MEKLLIMFCICISLGGGHGMAAASCVSGGIVPFGAQELGAYTMYRLAGRSVVRVTAADAMGSGVLWETDGEYIVIAASRHLLRKDVAAEVTFNNGAVLQAEIMGYSQQYDVGFLKIPAAMVPPELLCGLRAVRPILYKIGSEADRAAFTAAYAEWEIIQFGVDSERRDMGVFHGSIAGIRFVPVFNTHMLATECYARAGMSGGGVFDRYGRFWGLICGGEVAEDADEREAEVTYSLPPQTIAEEYALIMEEMEK